MTKYKIPQRVLDLQNLAGEPGNGREELTGVNIGNGYATATNGQMGAFTKIDESPPVGVWRFPIKGSNNKKEKHDFDCECECNYDPFEHEDPTFKHDAEILIDANGRSGGNGYLIKSNFPDFSKALPEKIDDTYHIIVLDVGLLKALADTLNPQFSKLEIAIPVNPHHALICRSANAPSLGVLMPCEAETDKATIIKKVNDSIFDYKEKTARKT